MQEIIVAIIGFIVLGFIGWKLYRFFTKKSSSKNACANCTVECALRDIQKEICDKDLKDKQNNNLNPIKK